MSLKQGSNIICVWYDANIFTTVDRICCHVSAKCGWICLFLLFNWKWPRIFTTKLSDWLRKSPQHSGWGGVLKIKTMHLSLGRMFSDLDRVVWLGIKHFSWPVPHHTTVLFTVFSLTFLGNFGTLGNGQWGNMLICFVFFVSMKNMSLKQTTVWL